jgi:alanyl-tRNA synthetase
MSMNTFNPMKEKFEKVFTHEQAEVLSTAINDAYSDLVKTGDFNELKDIVKDVGIKLGGLAEAQKGTENRMEELAEAQKGTENRMEELAEAQKRTENRVEELTEAQKQTEKELHELVVEHKETRRQLGGIADTVGYGLEDKIIPFMHDFVKKNYGMEATGVERKNMVYPNGRFDELNIYVEGTKDGKDAFAVGECKAQPGKKDIDKFHEMIERVRTVLKGELFLFMVGYSFAPEVESYIRENYPQIDFVKSYTFDLEYKRVTG